MDFSRRSTARFSAVHTTVALALASTLAGCGQSSGSAARGIDRVTVGSPADPDRPAARSSAIAGSELLLHNLMRYGAGRTEREAQAALIDSVVIACSSACLREIVQTSFSVSDEVMNAQPEPGKSARTLMLVGKVERGSLLPPRTRPGTEPSPLRGDALVTVLVDGEPGFVSTAEWETIVGAAGNADASVSSLRWG